MKNLKTIALYAMCSIAVFSSCKKDKDDAPAPAPVAATKTSLLTGKNWKPTSSTINGVETVTPLDPACENDDITTFTAASSTATNGTFLYDQKVKCDPSDLEEVNQTGKWKFNSAQTTIISKLFSPSGTTEEEVAIMELTSSTLKLKQVITDNGTTYTYIGTYKAQ